MGHNGGSHQAHQVVQLNKKILGNRKRNNRDKSYDSYNQKLQLPPMIKTPQDRSDRTYSVPTAGGGHAGTNSASANAANSNNLVHGHHHQYMLPLSPQANQSASGGAGSLGHHGHSHFAHQSSITPKTSTHAQMHQRQSINEGLLNATGDRSGGHGAIGLISGQGQGSTGSNPNGGGVSSSITGNQMFTRFSNIQLQNSLSKNAKISGQGGRAF